MMPILVAVPLWLSASPPKADIVRGGPMAASSPHQTSSLCRQQAGTLYGPTFGEGIFLQLKVIQLRKIFAPVLISSSDEAANPINIAFFGGFLFG